MAEESQAVQKKSVEQIVSEMQRKLDEIESLRYELRNENYSGITPEKSKALLEEIIVPSLEMIKEEKKKR